MVRKLPIGIQSFEDIRHDGYVYIDKTAYVYKLAVPNTEVERGLLKSLLTAWAPAATSRDTDTYTLRRLV